MSDKPILVLKGFLEELLVEVMPRVKFSASVASDKGLSLRSNYINASLLGSIVEHWGQNTYL